MRDPARGAAAEAFAETFLIGQGLRLEARNFAAACGEIDRIMWHHNTLVFVEVRLRTSRQFASAAESVTASKREKIRRTAAVYLQKHPYNCACRFDVLAVSASAAGFCGDWIQNAFE